MLNRLIKYIKFFWKSETLFTKRVSSMETNWKHYNRHLAQQSFSIKTTRASNVKFVEKILKSHFTVYWLPVIFYAFLIFYLSSISALSELPGMRSGPDTFADMGLISEFWPRLTHAIEYGIFSVLIFRAANNSKKAWLREAPFLWAILFASLYGISDELHQYFIPARSCSIIDWIADTIGVAVAQYMIHKQQEKKTGGQAEMIAS